jgi:hypothetical protein
MLALGLMMALRKRNPMKRIERFNNHRVSEPPSPLPEI